MAQQEQRGSRQQPAERDRPEQDAERNRDWADEAAEARTADDPRAMAPRDAGGRPSQGRPL
ncbi:hypothetical protein [Micromonospora endolithica]|uniref:Uncharacterized protein n=1 Tax=Micromonospora endolithica TaxID=230091 RepID=A0A3A9ZJY7_9ACTN|nr:hypothetical protein [Micromonospora endolithica]RKN48529.1 hypothetical protein D7223_11090 [Micromonospora endolithica]TWJ24385.1 hypothetical protein JD76_04535 [Micromonospora endolithica]